MTPTATIIRGDCLAYMRGMPDATANCCVTSPPYWGLRSYLPAGHPLKPLEIGTEATPEEYTDRLVAVFREVRRVLRDDGTLWMNLGDCYNAYNGGAGPSSSLSRGAQTEQRPQLPSGFGLRTKTLKPKDLVGIPWRVAFALQADGWYLRQDIIWHKPNPMPESVTDRCTKAHEYVFLLTKSERYYYDAASIAEKSRYPGDNRAERRDTRKVMEPKCIDNGSRARTGNPTAETRNRRSVWTVTTQPYAEAHFATFPPALIKPCIMAGCPAGGTVLDPFGGSGTTGQVALELGRSAILCELNPEYLPLIEGRTNATPGLPL